jgi:hypothetical protein
MKKKKTELQIDYYNKELAFQNKEKRKTAEELVKTKEQAEESDRLKLAFLANMTTRLEHQ